MNESFARHVEEDVRLIILRELHKEPAGRLNEAMLTRVVDDYGHTKSRDYVRTQIRKLDEIGAVRVLVAGETLIATITQAGIDHVEHRSRLEGVARPSRR